MPERRADGVRIGRRQPEDRHVGGAVGAERAGRQRPVDEHGARTGSDDLPNRLGGRCAAREQHGGTGDAAEPARVEEARESARRTDHRGRRRRERNDRCRHRDGGSHDATERLDAGDEDTKPGEQEDVTGRAPASRVDRARGERRGRTARAADAAVGRAGRPVVAGGGDDERVERGRTCRRGGERTVGERRERLDDADEGNAGRVVGITVLVRVDGELEPGEKLVGAAVDGDSPGRVGLPPRNADRQQRGPWRDALEPVRPVRADDEARHLGAVALGPTRCGRILTGARVAARVEHVEAPNQGAADIRVHEIDARVEQRHRDAGP